MSPVRRILALGATGVVGLTLSLTGVPAQAAGPGPVSPDIPFQVHYPVTGTTFLTTPKIHVPLGPTVLVATLQSTDLGKPVIPFTATMHLPPVRTTVRYLGRSQVTATEYFQQVGPIIGSLAPDPGLSAAGTLTSTASYVIKIRDLALDGRPYPVTKACQTVSPVTFTATNPVDRPFSIFQGGTVLATYTFPQFSGCRKATALLNALIPGAGNTVTLKLGKAS